jgi:hypothetical protein
LFGSYRARSVLRFILEPWGHADLTDCLVRKLESVVARVVLAWWEMIPRPSSSHLAHHQTLPTAAWHKPHLSIPSRCFYDTLPLHAFKDPLMAPSSKVLYTLLVASLEGPVPAPMTLRIRRCIFPKFTGHARWLIIAGPTPVMPRGAE